MLHPSYKDTLLKTIDAMQNKELVRIAVQFKSIPESVELALYLITLPEFMTLGLDMLYKFKEYKKFLMILLQHKKDRDALVFIRSEDFVIGDFDEDLVRELTLLVKRNKNMVIDCLENLSLK